MTFLATLDNLLWDRAMIALVFDFEYSWEEYIQTAKRKYGYYVLPVLYENQLIARFELEAVKSGEPFRIKNWWWQSGVEVSDRNLEAAQNAINEFAKYLCTESHSNNIALVKEPHCN